MAAAPPPRGRELRLLCLHGYGQNAERFRARTGALRKALRGRAQLLYLDAPHRLPPAEGEPEREGGAGPRGWWPESEAGPEPGEALRAVAAALAALGPVDGLLGFSQGAALAGLLCALRERGDGRFPFRFALLVAGFPVAEAGAAAAGALRVPSLHVYGEADHVIPAAESRALAGRFAHPALLAHAGGHFVPAAAAQRAAYLGFLGRFEGSAEDELGPPRSPPAAPTPRTRARRLPCGAAAKVQPRVRRRRLQEEEEERPVPETRETPPGALPQALHDGPCLEVAVLRFRGRRPSEPLKFGGPEASPCFRLVLPGVAGHMVGTCQAPRLQIRFPSQLRERVQAQTEGGT